MIDIKKQEIIKRFNDNVKGLTPDVSGSNIKHDGKFGHWLEKKMGIKPNADNSPDLFGYEMKNQTSSGKISYGDWSADEYIFHGKTSSRNATNRNYDINRDKFLEIFGRPNLAKDNRLSWSGTPCPTYYKKTTVFGQTLDIDSNGNITITYNYSLDLRHTIDAKLNKALIVPINMQKNALIIAKWNKDSIKKKLEKKFNQKGWFTCIKNTEGRYESICFGPPMNFNTWMKLFRQGIVYFDSGMYKGNVRPYSQWRSNTTFWDTLISEKY